MITRTRWERPIPDPDPAYLPKVSLQVPAYNEPPDMLIRTYVVAHRNGLTAGELQPVEFKHVSEVWLSAGCRPEWHYINL